MSLCRAHRLPLFAANVLTTDADSSANRPTTDADSRSAVARFALIHRCAYPLLTRGFTVGVGVGVEVGVRVSLNV